MSAGSQESGSYLPILKLNSTEITECVLVCGDPARAEAIASRLLNARELSYNREYRVFSGTAGTTPVTVVSHGVGAAGAAVCFEELIRGGARRLVRVGTAGSLAPQQLRDGDIVISTAAVRGDGLTDQLVAPAFPAVADPELTAELSRAAASRSPRVARGIILTVGAFYGGVDELPNNYYSRAGVLAVEMEAAALFVIASLRGIAAAGIFAIDGIAVDFDAAAYDPHREVVSEAIEDSIDIAVSVFEGERPPGPTRQNAE
jgi:uridine phosphorylase